MTSLKQITVEIKGIKCDACEYKDMSVRFEEYGEWLNKPCPECSANLLTQADYNNALLLARFADAAGDILPETNSSNKPVIISVETDGTGDMTFEVKDK